MLSTPTTVSSGSISFPAISSTPSTRPTPAPFSIKFPFATNYVWNGSTDIGADMILDQGNGSGAYYVDAAYSSLALSIGPGVSSVGTKNCVDSSLTNGAYGSFQQSIPAATNSSTHTGNVWGFDLPPTVPTLTAANLNTIAAPGINIGVACDNLWVAPINNLLLPAVVGSNGRIRITLSTTLSPALVGTKLWSQTGWVDTKTKLLMMAQAGGTTVEPLPPGTNNLSTFLQATSVNATSVSRLPINTVVVQWSHL